MQKIETLEQWIQQILARPLRNLNKKYSCYWDAEKEIEQLPCFEGQLRATQRIPRETIERLHQKLRRQRCEEWIWGAIISRIADPLSVPIAKDLIRRNIIVTHLGHTRQVDEIQWQLSFLVDEALLTFFHDMYTNPAYDVADVEKLLSKFPSHWWLIDKWQYWAHQTSSREKEMAFYRWVLQHPECPADSPSSEEYLNALIENEARLKREAEEERLRIEHEAEEKRLNLIRIAETQLDESEINLILEEKHPEKLLALASNQQIDMSWIQKLINCHHVKGSREIREVAQRNIETRKI